MMRRWLLLSVLGLGLLPGCSQRPAVGEPGEPRWPYAGIIRVEGVPGELRDQPRFAGRWMASPPGEDLVLLESSDPRFMIRLSFDNPLQQQYFDLGFDVEVETLAFTDRGRTVLLVAATRASRYSDAVTARALLAMDLELSLLTDSIPLSRLGVARGMAVNDSFRRVFLLNDSGGGEGVIRMIDLYGGGAVRNLPVGLLPAGIGRRGLASDTVGRLLFCLSGGWISRSDFEPVQENGETERSGPELLVVSADTLSVLDRIPLDPRLEPLAVEYVERTNRVAVLLGDRLRSRVQIVEPGFGTIRASIDLPEPVTDFVVDGPYGFAPGAAGVYVVDLEREMLAGRARFEFGFTGEIAVAPDFTRALVMYQQAGLGGSPGLAEVSLQTGEILQVLQ